MMGRSVGMWTEVVMLEGRAAAVGGAMVWYSFGIDTYTACNLLQHVHFP